MNNLKPCPFCNGEVTWCHCSSIDCPIITCPRCGQFDLTGDDIAETAKEAKVVAEAIWNGRPNETTSKILDTEE